MYSNMYTIYVTRYENQCSTVQEQQCSTVNEQQCSTVQVRVFHCSADISSLYTECTVFIIMCFYILGAAVQHSTGPAVQHCTGATVQHR